MPTTDTQQLTGTIQNLKKAASEALANQSAEDFESFERYLNEVEAFVRETQQAMWASEAQTTIRRLEKGEPLNAQDQELIRTFLISDAEKYLEHENNFQDWTRELQRLVQDIASRVNTVDRDSIGDLRGMLKDAVRLVPDIRNYFDEQRRVEKFQQALTTLDKPARDMLVRVLRDQLRRTDR